MVLEMRNSRSRLKFIPLIRQFENRLEKFQEQIGNLEYFVQQIEIRFYLNFETKANKNEQDEEVNNTNDKLNSSK